MKETVPILKEDDENDVYLTNDDVSSLTWEKIQVELNHRLVSDQLAKPIISNINGIAAAGEIKSLSWWTIIV